jgi:thiamine-phosphate pyrophosphorylase
MKAPVRGPRAGLPLPVLMLVTDRHLAGSEEALVSAVAEAVECGVNSVQLRENDLSPAELLSLAVRLREVIGERAVFVVNGSLEVALASGADGVHLPEAAEMIEQPERPFIIGRSVHSREAAERAWAESSDYVIAGPVFETASHPGMEPGGPALIEEAVAAVALPVLAIGGITAGRVEEVMRMGAYGVAVISAVLGSQAPGQAARELRGAVDAAWPGVGVIRL